MFIATIGLALPPGAAAQRAAPRGGGGHPSGGGQPSGGGGRPSGGGGHATGVAVPRTAPPHGYGSYYGSRYYGYGYPRYYYPYAYAGYYYPYYSGFSFGVGFGWGGAYWGGYARPYYAYPYYAYPYTYPYPDYRYENPAPTRVVQVSSGDTQAALFGTLSIRTIPPDAVILVDGEAWERPQGDTRFSIELANGPHHVEVRKDGFRTYVRTVDILGGRTFTLNVSLAD